MRKPLFQHDFFPKCNMPVFEMLSELHFSKNIFEIWKELHTKAVISAVEVEFVEVFSTVHFIFKISEADFVYILSSFEGLDSTPEVVFRNAENNHSSSTWLFWIFREILPWCDYNKSDFSDFSRTWNTSSCFTFVSFI